MSDLETMHYAVAKALAEVRAYRCHIKDLEELVGGLVDKYLGTGQNAEDVYRKLSELKSKYAQQEVAPCSDSSKLPPKT